MPLAVLRSRREKAAKKGVFSPAALGVTRRTLQAHESCLRPSPMPANSQNLTFQGLFVHSLLFLFLCKIPPELNFWILITTRERAG